jgi:hypothetical protein
VSEGSGTRGLLDTSVIVDFGKVIDDPEALLPERADISAIALAELSAGPLLTDDPDERARRLQLLQRVQAEFDPCRSTTAVPRPTPEWPLSRGRPADPTAAALRTSSSRRPRSPTSCRSTHATPISRTWPERWTS